MGTRLRRRLLYSVMLAMMVATLMSLALANDLLAPLKLQAYDLLFRLKPESSAEWARIVAIDDRSLAALRSQGRFFNWPRQLHARVIDNLKAAGARIIAWDVLFDAPAEGDAELAEAMRRAGNVVLAEPGDAATVLPPLPGQRFRYGETIPQLPAFREAAVAIGLANQEPDSDGTIRSMPLIMSVGGQDMPAFTLAAAAKFLRRPQVLEATVQNGRLSFVGRQIPVDHNNSMIINYLGESEGSANPPIPTLSYLDVLENRFPPDVVRGRMVLVGITATAFADDYWTPVSRGKKMDGVEIHAHAFETIMRPDRYVQIAPRHLTVATIVAAALLAVVGLSVLSPLPAMIFGFVVAVVYLAGVFVVHEQQNLVLDLPFPLLTLLFSYLAILMYRVIFEEAEQRALKGAMSQYLSPDIMEEVARDPGALRLGGEKRLMTVLFSDVRGFTSLAESLDAEKLVQLLNVYLTRMSDVVFKHQGTVDKYMGDAIMAFWGAPKAQPDHARLACITALEMVVEMQRLNAEFQQEGLPPLNMGIGINTGIMAVGNMGSERRFDYTVLGDAVNLGARLEGLNKEYGTNIIVAESTLEMAGGGLRARLLDLVTVKGKREPVRVYQLLAPEGPGEPPGALLLAYEAGLERYRKGDFAAAARHFEEALKSDADDGPSAVYLERCRTLAETPPPADWDGVFVMTRK